MDYKARDDMHIWLADQHEVPSEVSIPYFDCAHWNSFNEAKEKGIDFFANHLDFEEKNRFYQDLFKLIPDVPKETLEYYFSCPGLAISTVLLENVGLYIENFSGIPYSDEENKTLMRFGKVFQQTYTRFLDLHKAEAQAREAQIESALEKVRSRSIGMQKSEELREVIQIIHDQLIHLNFKIDAAGFTMDYYQNNDWNVWIANKYQSLPTQIYIPYVDHPQFNYYKGAKEKGLDFFANTLSFEDKNSIFSYMFDFMGDYPQAEKDQVLNAPGFAISQAFLKNITLWIYNLDGNPYTEEDNAILIRFAKVFEQTYVRFNDLKQAEAQARDAQIEASLERVRSRAMAIRKSDELVEVIQVIFQELNRLGFDLIECSIATYDTNPKDLIYWSAGTYGSALPSSVKLQYIDHPLLVELFNDFESGIQYRSGEYSGELLKTWWDRIFTETDFKYAPKEFIESWKKINQVFYSQATMNHGFLAFLGGAPLPDDKVQILKHFTNVVDLTYTRYDDVVQAEAQAREAQIEAALERVRSRTMAMHKSDDLTSAVATVFEELRKLGLKTLRCGVGIFDGKSRKINVWTSSSSEKSDSVQVSGDEMLEGHSLLDGIYNSWQHQQDYSYVLKGEDLTKYYNVVADSNLPVKAPEVNAANDIQYYHCVMFPAGGLFAFRESEFSAEAIRLMKRFADVFHLAFIRHLDLRNAEAQNIIIQAENDRKTSELEEARELQLSMLPKELPNHPNLDIAVYMQTATEVGGDYYDFHLGEDETLTAVIGDATGHGMKAGTMVTITKSLFDSLASRENILETFDIISKVIKGMKIRQLSMCLMMLKIKDDKLFLSSAAMPPVLIYQKKNQAVEEILVKGMPFTHCDAEFFK